MENGERSLRIGKKIGRYCKSEARERERRQEVNDQLPNIQEDGNEEEESAISEKAAFIWAIRSWFGGILKR